MTSNLRYANGDEAVTGQAKAWHIYPAAPEPFMRSVAEHPLLLQVLYNRGVRTATDIRAFLEGEDAILENPFRVCDVEPAVGRILHAIEHGETICVYGDFDADGVAATALLVSALQAAGGRVGPYIPDRVDEGYGLNTEALSNIAEKAHLLITVDCGIRSVAEVAYAREIGLDVIITDHHSIGPKLPPALAVINPRRKDCASTFDRLAGVGVAYRLAQGVLRAAAERRPTRLSEDQVYEIETQLLDLVALGTVADMMPLLGENRSLVRRGLGQLNLAQRPGIEALLQQADLRPGSVDAAAISFRLAPRINAAGRLAHAQVAYRLLRTQDPVEAYTLATELESLNVKRRTLTEKAQNEAEGQLEALLAGDAPMLFVHSPDLPSGIVGLVAGKLSERFYRPAVVVERGEEESRGSARSIPEFDISHALDTIGHYLVRHGGHSRAAGFTVKTANLPAVEAALTALAHDALTGRDGLQPKVWIDAEVAFDDLNWAAREQLARLEPTGFANAAPLLLTRGVRVRDFRAVGSGRHLKMTLDDSQTGAVVDGIAFNRGEWAQALTHGQRLDLVYMLEANEWQGRQSLQMNIQDLRLAGSGPEPVRGVPIDED